MGFKRALGWSTVMLLGMAFALPASAGKFKRRAPARRGARAAAAPAQNRVIEIKNVEVASANGTQVELRLFLYKPGSRERHPVKIMWVDGRRRFELWSGQPYFAGNAGGFAHTVRVNLAGKVLRRGKVEVIASECARSAKCKKSVTVRTADLKMDGHPVFEERGRDKTLKLKVKNAGPVTMRSCQVELKVDGRVVKRFPVRNLAVNRSQTITYQYGPSVRGKKFNARIKCNDLARGNNLQKGRLR